MADILTTEELGELKQYMRVDGDEDDALIEKFYAAALEYLSDAGICFNKERATHVLAASALTLSYYDNRDVEITGTIATALDFGLRKLINQLKFSRE